MRSVILCILLFFVFIYLLCFPQGSFSVLCLRSNTLVFFHVLPSLLPFMIFLGLFTFIPVWSLYCFERSKLSSAF